MSAEFDARRRRWLIGAALPFAGRLVGVGLPLAGRLLGEGAWAAPAHAGPAPLPPLFDDLSRRT
ncbi:MAG: hypothetical protein ACXWG8_10065, partial [Usitatibacter sp.]